MKKPILFLLGLLFVVSCTEQNDEPTHQAKQPEVQHNSPTRTPQEAQNEVADFLAAMGKKTRSATRPTIANVETLRSRQFATRAATDSLPIDTLLYFVNFTDNQGFAVVAADKRTSPILALIDKGNYKIEDLRKEDNPGFLSFLDRAVNQEIENSKRTYTTTEPTRAFTYNGWSVYEFIQPLLKVNWDQDHPYNIFCPGYKGKAHGYTGCAITAIAQICSYYKAPKELSWNSYGTPVHWTYDWDRILQDCSNNNGKVVFDEDYDRRFVFTAGEVASLMSYLGIELKAKYEKEGTGVLPNRAIDWIRKSGWFNATELKDYDENHIFQAIRDRFTVFADGYSHKTKTWLVFNKYEKGHAWVYDGYIRGLYQGRFYNLLHCNWGWNGSRNGYYLSKVFNTNNPPYFPSNMQEPTVRSNVSHYYQYKLQYSIISPNKR